MRGRDEKKIDTRDSKRNRQKHRDRRKSLGAKQIMLRDRDDRGTETKTHTAEAKKSKDTNKSSSYVFHSTNQLNMWATM